MVLQFLMMPSARQYVGGALHHIISTFHREILEHTRPMLEHLGVFERAWTV
jgi:hypothetical protein